MSYMGHRTFCHTTKSHERKSADNTHQWAVTWCFWFSFSSNRFAKRGAEFDQRKKKKRGKGSKRNKTEEEDGFFIFSSILFQPFIRLLLPSLRQNKLRMTNWFKIFKNSIVYNFCLKAWILRTRWQFWEYFEYHRHGNNTQGCDS